MTEAYSPYIIQFKLALRKLLVITSIVRKDKATKSDL